MWVITGSAIHRIQNVFNFQKAITIETMFISKGQVQIITILNSHEQENPSRKNIDETEETGEGAILPFQS